MDENNTYINKSEKEALEIMENVSDITSDQLQALRENEECFQTCSDIAEAVIGMQMEKNTHHFVVNSNKVNSEIL